MPYLNTSDGTWGHNIYNVREAYPGASIPDGVSYKEFLWYEPAPPVFDQRTHDAVEIAPVQGVQRWRLDALARDVQIARCWELIKAERDRRKALGVRVGEHWFHSDDASRIQQLALVMMGQAIPAGLRWKTLTLTPPPVFVDMTPTLAMAIFQGTAASDQTIFAAAEAHRVAMEAYPTPGAYNLQRQWPLSIEDQRP